MSQDKREYPPVIWVKDKSTTQINPGPSDTKGSSKIPEASELTSGSEGQDNLKQINKNQPSTSGAISNYSESTTKTPRDSSKAKPLSSEHWLSKPQTISNPSTQSIEKFPFIHSQKRNSKGDLITVIKCLSDPTKEELDRYRSLKLEHIILQEIINVSFGNLIPSPLKLKSLTVNTTIPSNFLVEIFQNCLNLKSFKILGEVEGNLLKPQSMSSVIEKTFPHLKTLCVNIGSEDKKHRKANLKEVEVYSKWSRDSMTLIKSSTMWAPTLEKLEVNTYVTQQWNWYQLSLRLLRFFTVHSKSLKQLDLTLALPPLPLGAIIESAKDSSSKEVNQQWLNLKPDEDQHLKNTVKALTRKNNFSTLQRIAYDIDTNGSDMEHWMMLLAAQHALESLVLRMTFKWDDIAKIVNKNLSTLKILEVTSDLGTSFDFSIVGKCENLDTIYLQHFNPQYKMIPIWGLDIGRVRMPRLEYLTLIGFMFHRSEVINLTGDDNCCRELRLKGLGILGESSTRANTDVKVVGSCFSGSLSTHHDTEEWLRNSNPNFGFTWDQFKKVMNIRSLEYLLFDPVQFSFTSAFEMANVCNIVGSIADCGPGGVFRISLV